MEECAIFYLFLFPISGIEKERLSTKCELWSADAAGGWRLLYSKSYRWQGWPWLGPSFTVTALNWSLRSQMFFSVYANSNLDCSKFYLKVTHASDFMLNRVKKRRVYLFTIKFTKQRTVFKIKQSEFIVLNSSYINI